MFSCARRKLTTILKCASYESPEFREDVVSLLKGYLGGPWNNITSKNILIEKLRGGLSNTVLQISLPPAIQNEVEDEPKSVILRLHQPLDESSVYQHMSDSLSFICLSERKFGPKLFGIFPGGRIEEYVDARPLTTAQLGQTKFSLAIAEKVAMIHFMHIPLMKKKGIMFDLMNDWLLQFSKESESWKIESSKANFEYLNQFQNADLVNELCWLRNFLGKQNSPVVLCHNDLQEGNILVKSCSVSEEKPKLLFIDYEYCFYNYRGFEFANHFLEYTMNYNVERYPNFIINEKMYPSVESQLKFFRQYLRVIKELKKKAKGNNGLPFYSSLDINGSDEADEEEEKLLMETSNFRLASHLFWAIWAALRSQSSINFGYWEYSIARLKAYYRTKEEVIRL